MRKILLTTIAVISAFTVTNAAVANNGVTDTEIVFGQTAAYNGPAAALGLGMKDGILAAFKEANDAGGVHGKQLVLKEKDDGYEPEAAIANAKVLINEEQVFALIGTRLERLHQKRLNPLQVKQKFRLSGRSQVLAFLRAADKTHVVNVRGSYGSEAETWIERLTTDLGAEKIAIFIKMTPLAARV